MKLDSKLDPRSSRLETPSLRVLRIENRVSSLEDRDASDCQLTFDQYRRMPEQESGVQFLFVNGPCVIFFSRYLEIFMFLLMGLANRCSKDEQNLLIRI